MMTRPSHDGLFDAASQQGGYFTAKQAHRAGFTRYLIRYHVRRGRFLRIRRGLYRLRQFPPSPNDHIIEAILAAGPQAVVSHESALALHSLADVVPSNVHLTVARAHRYVGRRVPSGVTVHTSVTPLPGNDVVVRGAVRITTPARSIADAAEAGTGPEQIVLAVRQALERGLTTRRHLLALATQRSERVARLIRRSLVEISSE